MPAYLSSTFSANRTVRLQRFVIIVVTILVAATSSAISTATAGRYPEPSGDIVFAKDDALWRIDASVPLFPVQVSALPKGAVTRLTAAPVGRVVIVHIEDVPHWVQIGLGGPNDPRRPAPTQCRGHAAWAPTGDRFACATDNKIVIQPIRWRATTQDITGVVVALRTDGVVVQTNAGLTLHSPNGKTRQLAPYPASGPVATSPYGTRAVAILPGLGATPTLNTFALDGKAWPRKLGTDEVPVAWSATGQWVLLNHPRHACVVSPIGGQYKCWNRYHAVALSPTGTHVLLGRKGDLYAIHVAGVHAASPKRIIRNATIAAWIPPISVPSAKSPSND